MLVCTNIQKKYGSVIALRSGSLIAQPGEIHAILGGNGSGKSTLAKILGGTVRRDAGEIRWESTSLDISTPHRSRRAGVTVSYQELSLLGNLTVVQNICFPDLPTRFGITDTRAAERRAMPILERLGIERLAKRMVDDLAPGEQYLVEFAKAWLTHPRLLILDEITSTLYRDQVDVMTKALREMVSKEKTAVLFISHRMPEIYTLCDKVTVMRNGQTLGTYAIADISPEALLGMITGDEASTASPGTEVGTGARQSTSMPEIASEAAAPRLEVHDLALPDVEEKLALSVHAGEIIGIAGLQGQGQSLLVRRLFGLLGRVTFLLDGKPLTITHPRDAVKQGFAFVSGDRERDGIFGERSIAENALAVNRLVLHKASPDLRAFLREKKVIMHSEKQRIRELSGGNQQKVVISRWTIGQPSVLLADDPTKGVDVPTRRDMHLLFSQLAQRGSSVVLVSSDEEELVQLAHLHPRTRIWVMYAGRIVKEFKGEAITLHGLIEASIPQEKDHAYHTTGRNT